ncbi:hypothetical protein JCM14076_07600 [Methylosoma difficile]
MLMRILLASLLLASLGLSAASMSEYELKAAFLLKFAQFTRWRELPSNQFNLCICGEHPFIDHQNWFAHKTLSNRPVSIQTINVDGDFNNCQILFVNFANQHEMSSLLEGLHNQPVLTVSDSDTAWDAGVMISMSTEPNRVSFRINNSAARAAKLELSALMLQLAKEVK